MIQLKGPERTSLISTPITSNPVPQSNPLPQNILVIDTMADNALVKVNGHSSGDENGANTVISSSSSSVNHFLSSSIDISLKLLNTGENNTTINKKNSDAEEKGSENEAFQNGSNKPLSLKGADKHSSVTDHAMSCAKSNSKVHMNGGYSSTNQVDLEAIEVVAINVIVNESKPSKLIDLDDSKPVGDAPMSVDVEATKSVDGKATKLVDGDATKLVGEATMSVDSEATKSVDGEATKSVDGEATKSVDGEATKSVDGEATKSVDGEATKSVDGEATKSVDGEAAKSVDGEAAKSVDGEAAKSVDGEAAKSVDGEAAKSVDGEATKSVDGEATKSVDGEATKSVDGEATKSVDGEATKLVDGEATKSVDSEATKSVDGEATKSVDDEATKSVDDEATKSVDDEATKSVDDEATKSVDGEATKSVDGEAAKSVDGEAAKLVDGEAAKSVDGEAAKSVDGEAAKSVDGEAAKSVDGESAKSVDGESAKSVDGESAKSVDGESAKSVDGESAKSVDGESAKSVDGESAKSVDGESAKSVDGESAKSVDGESAESVDGESAKSVDGEASKSVEVEDCSTYDGEKDGDTSELDKCEYSSKYNEGKDSPKSDEGRDSTKSDETLFEVEVKPDDSGSNCCEDSKLVDHEESQSVCLADYQPAKHNNSKSIINEDFNPPASNDSKLVDVGKDVVLDSMGTDAEVSKFRDLLISTKNITSTKPTNDIISTRNVEQKYNKHDCDFDMLLEAIDDVKDGMKIRTAALRHKVPYHRLYWFLKELHANSSDEEGDEDEDDAVKQRSLLGVGASKQSQATHPKERRSVDPSVDATIFHPAWKASSLEKCSTAEAIHMLTGNSSISLKPVLTQGKSNSASSNLPATQTSASSLSSAGSPTTEIAGCSLSVSSVSPSNKELLPCAGNSHEKDIISFFNIETGEEIGETGPATKKAKVENLSSQQLETDVTMKGDVATAPMPSVTEARSPMINIPVGIVKEFMSANSPLAAEANRGTKSSKPTSNGTVSLTLQETSAIEANGEHSNDGSVGSTGSMSSIKSNKSTKSAKSVISNGTWSPITCNGVSSRSHTPVDNCKNAAPSSLLKNSLSVVTSSSTSVASQLTAAASILASTISTTKATETPKATSMLSTTSTVSPMDTSVSVPTKISKSKSELRNFKHLSAASSIKETTTNNSTKCTNGFSNSEDSTLDPLNCSSDMLPDLSGDIPLSVDPLKMAAPLDTPISTVDSVLPVSSDGTELAPLSVEAQPVPASTASLPVCTGINGTSLSNQSENLDVRNGLLTGAKENSLVGDINGLKRSLDSDNASNDTKKQRLSPPLQESATTDASFGNLPMLTKDDASSNDNKMLLDAEVESLKKTASKLHKLKRMDLENLIIELFMSKLLHNHELGRYKTLCEKLEATLETNRKKTAQFHKEMDDLRKVTKRLREEHQARKEQLVTPIKIKRSVGIQAAPHIIQKGLASAHTAQATITPKTCRVGVSPGMQQSPGGNGLAPTSSPLIGSQQMMLFNSQPSSGTSPSSTHDVSLSSSSSFMRTSAGGVRLGLVSSSPSTLMVSSPSTAATSSAGADVTRRSFFLGQPLTSQAGNVSATGSGLFTVAGNTAGYSGSNVAQSSSATGKGASVIDLTDEEEGRAPLKAPQQTLVKMVPNSASFVTLPGQSGPGITAGGAQYVLVPNTVGSSTIMVTNMANNAATVAVAGGGTTNLSLTSTATRQLGTAGLPAPKPPSLAAPVPPLVNTLPQHPAPLPRTAPQQVTGGAMQLPPQPTLKLSHKANSIVLSWTMAKTIEHEAIASYQLYAYQESSQTPSPNLWKKVGSVKALELPMACTLTQFMPGHRYHFAVRAVDAKSRLGPFSDPRSIRLEK